MAELKLTFILLYFTTISFLLINKGCAADLVSNNKDVVENNRDIANEEISSKVGKDDLAFTLDKDATTSSAVSLEHESQGSPGEHFIALPAHNLGAVENLDPSLKGLSGIVTSKLPSSVRLIRIVDATREVVAGFRYDFTLEVVNTVINSEPYICVFALIERPWIITEWGSKERSVIVNNCTTEDKSVEEKPIIGTNINPSFAEKVSKISDNTENNELTAPLNNIDKVEPSTESTKVDNYDTVAEFGHIEEESDAMSPERLKDMEEQIIAKAEPHYLETVTVNLKEEPKVEGIKIVDDDSRPTDSTHDIESVTDTIKEDDINIEGQETKPTDKPYNIETATNILQENPKLDGVKLESSTIGETNPKAEPCYIETVTAKIKIYEAIKLNEESKTDEEKIVLKKDALDGLQNWVDNVRILDKSPKHQTSNKIEYKRLDTDPHKPVSGETLNALEGWLDDVRIKNKPKESTSTENNEENINIEEEITTQAVDTEKLNAFEGLLDLLEEPKVTKIEQTHTETEQDHRVPVEETFVAQKAFTLGTGEPNSDASSKSSESSEESTENKISEESSEEDVVTSYITRRKRSTNKNLLMKLANNAVNALDHIDSDNRKRVVLEILDSKQKIKSDGTYFTIKVRIATTDCSETVDNIGKCSKMIIKDTIKICYIEVKKNGDEERVIKSQCSPVGKLNRSKRDTLVGGVSPADPNESYVQELIADIKGSLESYHGLENPLNIKLISVTKQLVTGLLYKYEIEIDNNEFEKQACRVSVWDRPWLPDGREITAECGTPNSSAPRNKIEFKKKSTTKRSANNFEETGKTIRTKRSKLRGRVSPADPNDSYVQELLADIKGSIESYHGLENPLNVKIISVTKQLVTGSIYKYKIEIDNDEFEKQACTVSVWDRPWLPDGREITAECGTSNSNAPRNKIEFKKKSTAKRSVNTFEETNRSIRTKRNGLPGGVSPADPNNPYVQELLAYIKGNLETYHGLEHPLNIKVNSVSKQVVAGSLYKYEIEIDNNEFEKQACTVSVWDRPWISNGREITAECGSVNSNTPRSKIEFKKKSTKKRSVETFEETNNSLRVKRHTLGGTSSADPDDPYVQEILTDIKGSLQSYHGLQHPLNIKLNSVTRQVVAGSLYKYEIEIDNDEFEKQACTVSVWDRPWLPDGREITAECSSPNSNEKVKKITLKKKSVTKRSVDLRRKSQKKRSLYELENNHFELLRAMSEEDLMTLSLFDSFIKKYERTYSRNEFLFRFNVFKQNLEKINTLNRNERGTATYGITEFADLTRKEFKIHTGLVPREEETNEIPRALAELFENDLLPESFDWREKGAVSPVKNQGSCGSCWAFSVTGNIEGLNAIKTGKLEEFSEQELLDCDSIDEACNGGLPDNAYKAIEQIGGLESESDYPYEARKEKTCHFNSTLSKVKVKGAIDLPKNETKMAQFLVLNGPISIGINANAMQFYRGGVSHPWKALCNPKSLDHGVLIVGYGTHSYPKFKKDLPYWIIKNSWGPSWGEQGYYRVYRGDGTCGVDQMASSAIIE